MVSEVQTLFDEVNEMGTKRSTMTDSPQQEILNYDERVTLNYDSLLGTDCN